MLNKTNSQKKWRRPTAEEALKGQVWGWCCFMTVMGIYFVIVGVLSIIPGGLEFGGKVAAVLIGVFVAFMYVTTILFNRRINKK